MKKMDDDIPEEEPAKRKPSTIPSWVILGFILGATFVWQLPEAKVEPPPPASEPAVEIPVEPVTPAPPRLMVMEFLFERWGEYAIWDNNLTEIAVWNPETGRHSDFFEVRRVRPENGGEYLYYFRTIAGLSRPLLTRGVPEESLIRFTESEADRQRWNNEQLRRFLGGNRPAPVVEPPEATPGGEKQP